MSGSQGASLSVEEQFLAEAGFSIEVQDEVREAFQEACDEGQTGLTKQAFDRLMVKWGINESYCNQYFRAFDADGDGCVDYREFLLGLAALDPNTPHTVDDITGDRRLEYVFKVYDLDGDGMLTLEEFKHMVRHIRRARGENTAAEAVDREARDAMASIGCSDHFSMEEFKKAVKSLKFRGTSSLFRLPQSQIRGRITKENPSPVLSSQDTLTRQEGEDARRQALAKMRRQLSAGSIDKESGRRVHIFPLAVVTETGPNRHCRTINSTAYEGAALARVDELTPSLLAMSVAPFNHKEGSTVAEILVDRLIFKKWDCPGDGAPFQYVLPSDLLQLIRDVIVILKDEPTVLEIPAPCKVFGDIHGQFTDLLKFFETYGSPDSRTGDINYINYVFVGDWVDRGQYSLECVSVLFALKKLYPEKVCLIRGNHEDREVNCNFGFLEECRERLGDIGEHIWEVFNDAFEYLPLACLIEDSIFCIHGGIGADIHAISDLASIKKPIVVPLSTDTPQDRIIMDALWSDPTEHDRIEGIHENEMRGGDIVAFGPDRVREFCDANNLDLILRAHECVDAGFEFFAGGRLMTLFSATNYCGKYPNDGAMCEITLEGRSRQIKVRPKVISHKTKEEADPMWRSEQFRPPTPPRGRQRSPEPAPPIALPVIPASSAGSSRASSGASSGARQQQSASASGRTAVVPSRERDRGERDLPGVSAGPFSFSSKHKGGTHDGPLEDADTGVNEGSSSSFSPSTVKRHQTYDTLTASSMMVTASSESEFLEKAGFDDAATEEVRKLFVKYATLKEGAEILLSEEDFTNLLVSIGVNKHYCRQYFRACDVTARGALCFRDFLLAMAAMDPATPHTVDDVTGDMRLNYIFGVYDLNGDGWMSFDEFVHLVRHTARARGENMTVLDIDKATEKILGGRNGKYDVEMFKEAVRGFRIRGTSSLFRLPTSCVK